MFSSSNITPLFSFCIIEQIDPIAGWEVKPLIESMARSTISTFDSIAAKTLAEAVPEVSWVWKWIGKDVVFFISFINNLIASGLHKPAISFMAIMFTPAFSKSWTNLI